MLKQKLVAAKDKTASALKSDTAKNIRDITLFTVGVIALHVGVAVTVNKVVDSVCEDCQENTTE